MEHIGRFLSECRLNGLSGKTISNYAYWLGRYLAEVDTHRDLEAFIEWLSGFGNPRTIRTIYTQIKVYVAWAARENLEKDWIGGFKPKRRPAAEPQVLSAEEFEKIIDAMPLNPNGIRDQAFYSLAFYVGARRESIDKLLVENVDLQARTIRIIGKGGKEQLLPLPRIAALRLTAWFALRSTVSCWAFPSLTRPSKAVDAGHMSRMFKRYAKQAGISRRVYVHLCRHSAACAFVEGGVSIDVVQALLGHQQISTTQVYAKMSFRRLSRAMDSVFN